MQIKLLNHPSSKCSTSKVAKYYASKWKTNFKERHLRKSINLRQERIKYFIHLVNSFAVQFFNTCCSKFNIIFCYFSHNSSVSFRYKWEYKMPKKQVVQWNSRIHVWSVHVVRTAAVCVRFSYSLQKNWFVRRSWGKAFHICCLNPWPQYTGAAISPKAYITCVRLKKKITIRICKQPPVYIVIQDCKAFL